jgi:hypothetical protein
MTEKELIYQFLGREVSNILTTFSPSLSVFTPAVMNFIKSYCDPYIDLFISPDTAKLNTDAVGGFLKEETGKKIEDFLKRYEAESLKHENM